MPGSAERNRSFTIGMTLCALAGAILVWQATRFGPVISTDSVVYIQAADNWLAGRGLSTLSAFGQTKPVTHFPPLYPLLLAGGRLLGLGVFKAARLFNAVLFGLTAVTLGEMLKRISSSAWVGFLGMLLALSSPILLELSSAVMTEPLYLFLGLAAIYLYSRYRETGNRVRLIAAALAVGLAYLTRYVGISLVVTLLLLELASRPGRGRRYSDLILLAAISLGPAAMWMLRNLLQSGSPTNRSFSFHPLSISQIKTPFSVLWSWLTPLDFSYAVLLGLALGLLVFSGAGLVYAWRNRASLLAGIPPGSFQRICLGALGLDALVYACTLLLSLLALDASTPIDLRTTSPLYINLGVLILVAAARLGRHRLAVVVGGLLLAALFTSYCWRSADYIQGKVAGGSGLVTGVWKRGRIREVRWLPESMAIYTNNLEALYFLYGVGGYQIVGPLDPVTQRLRPDSESTLRRIRQLVDSGEAVLLLFDPYEPTPLQQQLLQGLHVLGSDQRGALLVGDEFPLLLGGRP